MNDYYARMKHLSMRTFGWGEGSQLRYDSPGHYICARDRVCLKCNHYFIELMAADHYIPCLDEMEPVGPILPPPTLAERGVKALEEINTTLKHKKFDTDLKPLMEKIDEQTRTLYGALKRRK